MRFADVIATRRSVRAYERRDVEAAKLRSILEAACAAPSAGNLQSWRVAVVQAAPVRHALAAAAHGQGFVEGAPLVLVFCADVPRSEATYGERGATLFAMQDATIAAAYAQLAATSLGLGSCWLGAFDEGRVSAALKQPEGRPRPVAILTIGYAAEQPERPQRRAVEELILEAS
jgi:nitroreductase